LGVVINQAPSRKNRTGYGDGDGYGYGFASEVEVDSKRSRREETARAKAERIIQVTALPDPMVTTRTLPEPIRTAEGDNFFVLGISERFPIPKKLDRAGRIALEDTRAALQRLQEVRLRIIAEVKRAYFQLYVLDKSIEITGENQRLLRGLIDVARAQVAAGRRPQDDVLRAQVELSSLEAELISLRQRRVSMVAQVNELLDRTPNTPVASLDGFDIRKADLSLDQLLDKATGANPALKRLKHLIERDEHAVGLARLAYWPDFTLGLEWMYMEPRDAFRPPPNPMTGQRPAVPTMSEDGTDNWAITFGFSLPIWFDKIEGGINEARYRLLATRQEYAATQNRIEFQIVDALERVRAQRDLAALFDSTIIPQAQQTYQISQTSYVAGASDFLYVIDNWRKWLVFTIQYHRSLGELERSVADLEEAIGLSLSELGEP
ncbi:MAG TPA: TolC family protein, partial [Coriobacteriia bacterium]|nr:TolC family protein [Coriobacteriia bacterium]